MMRGSLDGFFLTVSSPSTVVSDILNLFVDLKPLYGKWAN
jgi:hypothetical protein